MDIMSDIFDLFGLDDSNRFGFKRGQRFIEGNPSIVGRPDYLEFNGMLEGKMEFSILMTDFKNYGGCRLSEDEDSMKRGIWIPV